MSHYLSGSNHLLLRSIRNLLLTSTEGGRRRKKFIIPSFISEDWTVRPLLD